MSKCRARGKEHGEWTEGFTLVEVLLAMTILAVIVTVIYVSFSTTGRNIDEAERRRDTADLARTLIARLSEDIANAYYNPSMKETVFYGKRSPMTQEGPRLDSLALTTLTNWRKPDSKEMDLWEVGYRFEEHPEGGRVVLVRREKRSLVESTPLEGGDDLPVTDAVVELQLKYFDGSQWVDEWDSRGVRRLPKAVEIRLALRDGAPVVTRVEAGRQ